MLCGTLAFISLFAASALCKPIAQAKPPLKSITATSAAPGSNSGGTSNDADLVSLLLSSPTALHRLSLLPDDLDFVFDFNNPPANATTSGKGKSHGRIVRNNQMTFPALVGQNSAVTMGFLGPCGFNTPHTHPRAAEVNIIVEGTLYAQMTMENGARTVTNKLEKYQMTVFPQGSMHTDFNPSCSNATFVAAFPSSDPGTQQAAQTLFGLSEDLVSATFGEIIDGSEVAKYYGVLPTPVAKGITACLARCGIAMK